MTADAEMYPFVDVDASASRLLPAESLADGINAIPHHVTHREDRQPDCVPFHPVFHPHDVQLPWRLLVFSRQRRARLGRAAWPE